MRKLTILLTFLTLSAGLWAETQMVSYRYPVYNTPDDPKSGIASWQTGRVNATVVENATEQVTWGTEGETTWYVVTGSSGRITLTKGAVCRGDVHLILSADELNASAENNENGGAGIEVSGSNSLTIYGQPTAALNAVGAGDAAGIGGGDEGSVSNITINGGMVTARGGSNGAGIGGGYKGNGSNITINGGEVTATGGSSAAGIGGGYKGNGSNITINGGTVSASGAAVAAGIGGGQHGSGSDITINYGTVAANGGEGSAGIGGGEYGGAGENITVAVSCLVKAGGSENPTTIIEIDGGDIASILAGKRYVTVKPHPAYARGIEEGQAEALGEMGEPCEDCPAVDVTKGTKTIRLYNPDKVEFKKE